MLDHRGGTHLTAFYSPARRGRALRLHIAMNANDTESFAQILAADPALLTDDYEELQLEILGTCAYTRKPAIARALLDAGASISRPPVPESRALTWAIDYGCSEMIELLLELYEPRDDLPTWAGLGDLDRVTAFFDETGALRPGSALVYPENDTSGDASRILSHALGLACMNRNIDVATYLVDRGADIDGVWGQHEPATVLHELAGNGVVESIAWILGRGASVTARDVRFGGTALDWSVYCGRDEARALLEAPTVEADLVAAIEYGCVDDVVAHIGRGSDVNAALDYIAVQSVTPLCFAVRRGDAAMVQALLEAGAHATHLDSNGNGPLHRLDATTADAEAIRTLVHRHSEPPS
jgi:ankyrin repeat protein